MTLIRDIAKAEREGRVDADYIEDAADMLHACLATECPARPSVTSDEVGKHSGEDTLAEAGE